MHKTWSIPRLSDETSATPLIIASFFGLAPAIAALINAGSDLLVRDSKGRTVLHWAAEFGRLDAAKLLIESQGGGVYKGLGWLGIWKPAIIEAANNSGKTPLMCAVSGESASVTNLLLDKGADIEASRFPTADGVQLLLQYGVDVDGQDWDAATRR